MNGERRHRLALADLTAMDLIQQALLMMDRKANSSALNRVLSDSLPQVPRLHEDHFMIVLALAGQAANLLLAVAHQAGLDPMELLEQLRAQTAAEAAQFITEDDHG